MHHLLNSIGLTLILTHLTILAEEAPRVIWQDSAGGPFSEQVYQMVDVGPDEYPVFAAGELTRVAVSSSAGKRKTERRYRTVIRRYNPVGSKEWEVASVGKGSIRPISIAIDRQNHVYLSAQYRGTVDLGSKGLKGSQEYQGILARFTPKGELQWLIHHPVGCVKIGPDDKCILAATKRADTARKAKQPANELMVYWISRDGQSGLTRSVVKSRGLLHGCALDVNERGEILVASNAHQDFQSGSEHFESKGAGDILLVRLRADGSTEWTRQYGNHSSESVNGIAWRSDGDFYLAGRARFLPLGKKRFFSKGKQDGFVGRFGPDGSCRWIRRMGGSSYDSCSSITTGPNNEAYCVGALRRGDKIEIGKPYPPVTSSGSGFITRMDSQGTFHWTKFVNTDAWDTCDTLAMSDNGTLYVTGRFGFGARSRQTTLSTEAGIMKTFPSKNPEGVHFNNPPGGSDVFLLALEQPWKTRIRLHR